MEKEGPDFTNGGKLNSELESIVTADRGRRFMPSEDRIENAERKLEMLRGEDNPDRAAIANLEQTLAKCRIYKEGAEIILKLTEGQTPSVEEIQMIKEYLQHMHFWTKQLPRISEK